MVPEKLRVLTSLLKQRKPTRFTLGHILAQNPREFGNIRDCLWTKTHSEHNYLIKNNNNKKKNTIVKYFFKLKFCMWLSQFLVAHNSAEIIKNNFINQGHIKGTLFIPFFLWKLSHFTTLLGLNSWVLPVLNPSADLAGALLA